MADELTPDICVVGGGPGGIAAALAAAAAGLSVVLVERAAMGGNDLASGSVPSKALIAAADAFEALRIGPALGVTGAPLQVNLARVREHIVAVGEAIAPRLSAERLTAQGVKVLAAAARFGDRRTIVAGDHTVRARRVILAVGSVPAIPDIPGLDTVEYMTTAGGFDLSRKPAHLIVLGAGPHALELAQACNRLGIDATVVSSDAALPDEDPELAAIVVDRLRAEGIRVRAGVGVRSVARRKGGIRMIVTEPAAGEGGGSGEITVDGSHLLIAAGRTPAVEGLNLAAAGIAHDRSGIVVDRHLRTANRHVYSIGDAVAGPALATRAEEQAARVIRSILFPWPGSDGPPAAASAIFTDPALASVGLSEADARARHRQIRVLRFPFVENDRAQIERLPAGMIKVVTTEGGQILGAAIVGRDAGELIAPWAIAVANRLSLSAMASFVAAYPTRSGIANRVAALPEARLTSPWRRRIIDLFRKFG